MENQPTVKDIAQFMIDEMNKDKNKYLYQENIVMSLDEKFGKLACYYNDNGNLAISKKDLKMFKELTPGVVWDRSEKAWRERNKSDEQDKRQA